MTSLEEPLHRCPCDFSGCDQCRGTGYLEPEPPREIKAMVPLGDTIHAFASTLVANMERAAATGHELTEDEISPAEVELATALTRHGITVAQQHPIGPYFADFYLPDTQLVIEVDGAAYHTDHARDIRRDEYMREKGCRVIRFRALRVFVNADLCVRDIKAAIREQTRALAELGKHPRP